MERLLVNLNVYYDVEPPDKEKIPELLSKIDPYSPNYILYLMRAVKAHRLKVIGVAVTSVAIQPNEGPFPVEGGK